MKTLDQRQDCGCVLLVDDDAQLRQMLGLALQTGGFQVREAATPAEAFRWLATSRPAIVVLDLQNDPHGLTMLRALRERPQFDDLPVVLLVGRRSDELRWQALKAGADWFSFKPLSLRELQERVGDLVQHGRPRLRAIDGLQPAHRRLAG
jgi:DNA-binding response OmpR family regulator